MWRGAGSRGEGVPPAARGQGVGRPPLHQPRHLLRATRHPGYALTIFNMLFKTPRPSGVNAESGFRTLYPYLDS